MITWQWNDPVQLIQATLDGHYLWLSWKCSRYGFDGLETSSCLPHNLYLGFKSLRFESLSILFQRECMKKVYTYLRYIEAIISKQVTLPLKIYSLENLTTSVTRWLDIFFNIWTFATMNIGPIMSQIIGSAICQIRNKLSKICQILVNFWQSGEISPNLVTW